MSNDKKTTNTNTNTNTNTPATYQEWMQTLSTEARSAEYERSSTVIKSRQDYIKASEVDQRLADLGENPLPESLVGVRFIKRTEESTEYDTQLGVEAFTVIGLQGRHGDAHREGHVSHRFILLQLDSGEVTIVDIGGFFDEILYCYSVDVAAKQRAAVNAVAFVPAYLVGKTFRVNKDAKDRNWFGFDEFTVVGDVGPWVVPGRETASGSPYVMTGQVCVEVEGSLMTLMRSEFLDLTGVSKRLYKLVK